MKALQLRSSESKSGGLLAGYASSLLSFDGNMPQFQVSNSLHVVRKSGGGLTVATLNIYCGYN